MDKAIKEAAQRMAAARTRIADAYRRGDGRAEDNARLEFGAAAFQHDMAALRLWREINGEGASAD